MTNKNDGDHNIPEDDEFQQSRTKEEEVSIQRLSCSDTTASKPKNGTSSNQTENMNEKTNDSTDNPVEFWKKWSCLNKECFDENGRQTKNCNCFEGIGSIM
jgi:hypothetical protein